MRRQNRKNKVNNRSGRICVSLIAMTLLVVMSVQIFRLKEKNENYMAQEQNLMEQLEAETERQDELEEYEQYTKSQDYVEDVAKSKLGLVYKNEIIFKEKSED